MDPIILAKLTARASGLELCQAEDGRRHALILKFDDPKDARDAYEAASEMGDYFPDDEEE